MLFSKEYVGYLAREVTKRLIAGKFIDVTSVPVVTERVNGALVDELSLEDRINDEVRVILEAYSDEMRNSGANYQEMFRKVKTRTRAQVQGGPVRLSRDKVNVLARAVSDVLKQLDEVDFIEDPNTIRQETRKILEDLLNQEARIDVAARQKIDTQKRTILEGSQEWDILYRKYYNEEVKKLGV